MKTSRSKTSIAGVVILMLTVMAAAPAWAELIALDQFSGYTVGQLSGQGQGSGWSGNWTGNTNGLFESGGLTCANVPSSGGNAFINSAGGDGWVGLNRTLAAPITTDGTYYFGFLFQLPESYPFHGIVIIQDNSGLGSNYWAGWGRWNGASVFAAISSSGYTANNSSIGLNSDVAHLVLKVNFSSSGNSSVDMYVNPDNAAALASTSDARIGSLKLYNIGIVGAKRVNQGQSGSIAFDEIRVGTEASDMFAPIPPSGTVLIIR